MRSVRVAAVSDLHGNLDFDVPQCDILAIAGDICPVKESHHPTHQAHWLEHKFYPWCVNVLTSGVGQIVFTPGNHDFVFQKVGCPEPPQWVTLLIDRPAMILGVKFYGTPWSLEFGHWAFMLNEHRLAKKYDGIPVGLDVLISHGPAYGLCDTFLSPAWPDSSEKPLGSRALRDAVERVKPHRVLCGHIHTGSHEPVRACEGAVEAVNVSLLDEKYNAAYKPYEFTVEVQE